MERWNHLPYGGLKDSNIPMICTDYCWIYQQGLWSMQETFYIGGNGYPAASQSPFDGQLWISGGDDSGLIYCT